MNFPPSSKKKTVTYTNDSILESLRDLGSGISKTVTRDVARRVATDSLNSVFGTLPKSGELKPNQPLNFTRETRPARPAFIRPEFVRQPTIIPKEDAQVKYQLENIRRELQILSKSLKNLNLDVQKAIETAPVHPGVYHVNFLERLKSILKILREQIEDSRSWLALWTNRKKQKQFWGLYKKHGTKFGLSSERTMATQAG